MNEARVRQSGDGEDDVWCTWRMKAIEDNEFSGSKVYGGFE